MSRPSIKNEALEAAIDAAERCMRALRTTTDENEKTRLDKQCRILLGRAERIKTPTKSERHGRDWDQDALKQASTPSGVLRKLKGPLSSRKPSTREQIILLEGSKLNGFVFPPWRCPPEPCEFELQDGLHRFLDTADLRLSSSQLEVFDGWKRPEEIFSTSKLGSKNGDAELGPTMVSDAALDLVQDITTDCSVVASLCAVMARVECGHAKIISSIVYPYDQDRMTPSMSPNGKYVFRLHFNGTFRRVVIDDRLPASRTSRSLHVIDRNNPGLLWPALLEKAYLKVRGGYDFPGSNSGTDLWVLTGWVPEQVFLQSGDIVPSKLWQRVLDAWSYGDVLLTMGTGRLTEKEEEGLGLAGLHDYAVLEMKEIGESRLVLIKNPWSRGTTWKGTLQRNSTGRYSKEDQDDRASTRRFGSSMVDTSALEAGTFWMDLDSVFQNFESIYLNWNPRLFSYRQDVHFSWDLTKHRSAPGCFFGNPQYSIKTSTGDIVWLLLSRHFKTTRSNNDRDCSQSESAMHNDLGFISLYAFEHAGHRVFQSDGALQRGPYVDSPNTLLRLDAAPKIDYTVVVSEQYLSCSKHSFTLTAFSLRPLVLAAAAQKYTCYTEQEGAWSTFSAGGNANSSSYFSNPQFSLQLPASSDVALLIETSGEGLSVNVKLIWADGKRVTTVTTRDIAGDSGEYRRGSALAEMQKVPAGMYTVICSSFEPGQLGKFVLRTGTMAECIVKPLPVEGAGRLRPRVQSARFLPGVNRLFAPLSVRRITRLEATARHQAQRGGEPASARSPLKISIEFGQRASKDVLVVSADDDFSDSPAGVRIPDIDLLPDMHGRGLWLVLERLGGSGAKIEERVDVELLSEGPVEVGQWASRSE